VAPAEQELAEPADAGQRALIDQYVAALATADVTAFLQVLREDAELEMPPYLTWFAGREAVARFLAARTGSAQDAWRMVLTGANGQPAIATYLRDRDGIHRAHSIQVLTIAGPGIARVVSFLDPGLFAAFGLPQEQPAGQSAISAGDVTTRLDP
jgi:RNA polymerase sigma-70 factor (ECF subfamily)